MRILIVTHYYAEHASGVEIIAGQLARGWSASGHAVAWAASDLEVAKPMPGVRRVPMQTWNLTEQRWGIPYPLWGPRSLVRLCREVRECDLVHLHDVLYFGSVAAYGLARLFRKPTVITQHIGAIPYNSWVLRSLLAIGHGLLGRLLLGGCSAGVFYSEAVRSYFERFVSFRRPPAWIINGLDKKRFFALGNLDRTALRVRLGWPAEAPVMLFVGRFVEKKGLTVLRDLAASFPECRWVFIGWGPNDPARWGLGNVQCLGRKENGEIAPYYQAADLLVLPSVGEGFPLVVQEAMACGTPALISRETARGLPGIEAVAYVCDLRMDELRFLVREQVARLRGGQARRELVARFAQDHWPAWEVCGARYADLFAKVLAHCEPRQVQRLLARQGSPSGRRSTR